MFKQKVGKVAHKLVAEEGEHDEDVVHAVDSFGEAERRTEALKLQERMNDHAGAFQREMQAGIAAKVLSGELAPVEGISLDLWAALNASMVQGSILDDLLQGHAIERERWERVTAEWNLRMSRDRTFAITTAYGNAFQAASKGKFSAHAKEANAARTENRDLKLPPPVEIEEYYDIMYDQTCAARAGLDPIKALNDRGLSIMDFTDLGCYMAYLVHRTGMVNHERFSAAQKRAEAKYVAKYSNLKTALGAQR